MHRRRDRVRMSADTVSPPRIYTHSLREREREGEKERGREGETNTAVLRCALELGPACPPCRILPAWPYGCSQLC